MVKTAELLICLIKIINIELKKYLAAYKSIAFFLLAGVFMGILSLAVVREATAGESLFEPFTIGVVNNDDAPELIFVFDFFNEQVIDLEFMAKSEAEERLANGDIPAFIELPQNFAADVFRGENSPFNIYISGNFPLQESLVQMLASGGIAYLSVSQAAVHATLEYAYNSGMLWSDVQQHLLIPVNIAFAQELINHSNLFVNEELLLVLDSGREVSVSDYFLRRFAVFWHMLSLLAINKFLSAYDFGTMARFKLANVPKSKIFAIKAISLFIIVNILAVPILFILGLLPTLLSSLFITFLGLFAGKLFKDKPARALFIFSIALVMYFASGGIVPFVFLPAEILPMRWLSINYWVASL